MFAKTKVGVLTAAATIMGFVGSLPTASVASAAPKSGGSLTFSAGATTPTVLDWTQTGFAQPGAAVQMEYGGSLFLPPTNGKGGYIPDLATGYKFNKNATQFTMKLRPGLKFSDGTPLNAAAVAYNWSAQRDGSKLAFTNQYFAPVKSVKAKGPTTVVVNFSQPNSVWIAEVASEPLGLMASPTAVKKEGQAKFDLMPVGAGPFMVTSNTPNQQITLKKNPLYWDAKHVYLSSMDFKATSPDPMAQYVDLQAGSLSTNVLSGLLTPPTVLKQALGNTKFKNKLAGNDTFLQIPVNTTKAPFDNLKARQALDYCLDRNALAKFVTGGYASPAWVYGGPDESFYPTQNGKASLAAAQKLMPYQYNVAKGKQLVSSLGGLSFTWDVLNLSTQMVTVATAVEQQWAQCGIKAKIAPIAPNVYNAMVTQGNYQLGLNPSGGELDPRLNTTYVSAQSPLNEHGFKDAAVQTALVKSFADTSNTALTADWKKIWSLLDKDAVDIPLLSGGNYNIYSPCIQGIQYNYGQSYLHASLTCTP